MTRIGVVIGVVSVAGALACKDGAGGSSGTGTATAAATSSSPAGSAPSPTPPATSASTTPPLESQSAPSPPTAAPEYATYTNSKFGFSVDYPVFFVKGPADGDGRGQPFSWQGKATMRAWGMYNVPVMSKEALFADWTRRSGVLSKTLEGDSWTVTAKDGSKLWYSKSILNEGVITTAEVTYDASLKERFEPILAHIAESLKPGSAHKK